MPSCRSVANGPQTILQIKQLTKARQLMRPDLLQDLPALTERLLAGRGRSVGECATGRSPAITSTARHREPRSGIGPAQALLQAITLHQHRAGTAQGIQPHRWADGTDGLRHPLGPRRMDRASRAVLLDRSTPADRSASAFAGKLNPQTYPTDGAQELRRHEIRRTASGDQAAA